MEGATPLSLLIVYPANSPPPERATISKMAILSDRIRHNLKTTGKVVGSLAAAALVGYGMSKLPIRDAINAARFQHENRQLAHRVGSSLREQRDAERAANDAAFDTG